MTPHPVAGEALPLGEHGPSMPSVVALAEGEIVVGWRAIRVASVDPASTRPASSSAGSATRPRSWWAARPTGRRPSLATSSPGVVEVARSKGGAHLGRAHAPRPRGASTSSTCSVRRAALRRRSTAWASCRSPFAAAEHHVRQGRLREGDVVAVYDFGGGTFKDAVVKVTSDGATLLGQPEGLERLGGIDLDQAVVAHVNASLDGALSELDTGDDDVRRGVQALHADCTAAKEALSVDTETTVAVAVPGLQTQVRITHAELEAAVRPRLAETLGALDRVLASAGLAAGDLAGVVLVGGSSRRPSRRRAGGVPHGPSPARRLRSQARGRPRRRDPNPSARCGTGASHEQQHPNPPSPPTSGGASGWARLADPVTTRRAAAAH